MLGCVAPCLLHCFVSRWVVLQCRVDFNSCVVAWLWEDVWCFTMTYRIVLCRVTLLSVVFSFKSVAKLFFITALKSARLLQTILYKKIYSRSPVTISTTCLQTPAMKRSKHLLISQHYNYANENKETAGKVCFPLKMIDESIHKRTIAFLHMQSQFSRCEKRLGKRGHDRGMVHKTQIFQTQPGDKSS